MKISAPAVATIEPRVVLRRIVIELAPHEPPRIEMAGDVIVKDSRVGRVSEARIVTHHLPPIGRQFISEMADAFGSAPPEKQRRIL